MKKDFGAVPIFEPKPIPVIEAKPKETKKQRHIAIVGASVSSRMLAPYKDDDWEIWACSDKNFDVLPRVDAWFELHSLIRKAAEAPWFIRMLAKHPRVYLAKSDPNFPGSIAYPRHEMIAKYGTDRLSSSMAYMLALAIELKPERIGIFGVDMSTPGEYAMQRTGMKMMIEEAEKAGIKIGTPMQCDLLAPTPPYAFKEESDMYWKLKDRHDTFVKRKKDVENEIDVLELELHELNGALKDIEYTIRIFMR